MVFRLKSRTFLKKKHDAANNFVSFVNSNTLRRSPHILKLLTGKSNKVDPRQSQPHKMIKTLKKVNRGDVLEYASKC